MNYTFQTWIFSRLFSQGSIVQMFSLGLGQSQNLSPKAWTKDKHWSCFQYHPPPPHYIFWPVPAAIVGVWNLVYNFNLKLSSWTLWHLGLYIIIKYQHNGNMETLPNIAGNPKKKIPALLSWNSFFHFSELLFTNF